MRKVACDNPSPHVQSVGICASTSIDSQACFINKEGPMNLPGVWESRYIRDSTRLREAIEKVEEERNGNDGKRREDKRQSYTRAGFMAL